MSKTIREILTKIDITKTPDNPNGNPFFAGGLSVDEALTQIQQLIKECEPELREAALDSQTGAPVGMDGCIDYGFNQAIDQYTNNLKEIMK